MDVDVLERAEDHVVSRFYCRPLDEVIAGSSLRDPRLNSSLRLLTLTGDARREDKCNGKKSGAGTWAYLIGDGAGEGVLRPHGAVVGFRCCGEGTVSETVGGR
jgi:hypothetical protein